MFRRTGHEKQQIALAVVIAAIWMTCGINYALSQNGAWALFCGANSGLWAWFSYGSRSV